MDQQLNIYSKLNLIKIGVGNSSNKFAFKVINIKPETLWSTQKQAEDFQRLNPFMLQNIGMIFE